MNDNKYKNEVVNLKNVVVNLIVVNIFRQSIKIGRAHV